MTPRRQVPSHPPPLSEKDFDTIYRIEVPPKILRIASAIAKTLMLQLKYATKLADRAKVCSAGSLLMNYAHAMIE